VRERKERGEERASERASKSESDRDSACVREKMNKRVKLCVCVGDRERERVCERDLIETFNTISQFLQS